MHILLTGSTGLLGRYLLKDLSLANIPIVTVVRPKGRQSAQERIDNIMANLEEECGQKFQSPHVLAGDICEPNLGLNDNDLKWLTENCDSVLHNAASLTFHATSDAGEPWRSNVEGVKNVLDLCEKTGIKDFHHVSTAYVCGLRTDKVLESDLDVGQELGNDYERSKIQAEELIRSASFLSPPTVFRPSIIVGDSQTGFTTTFHGYYVPLRLIHTLSSVIAAQGEEAPERRLSLDGSETKHFVPVDWVSAAMVSIIQNPEHHGQTYHLTPPNPVTTTMTRDVLEKVTGCYGAKFCGADTVIDDPTEIERLFYDHIEVYNSYWRDDPVFDRTNILKAAPHLPCPEVTEDMLQIISKAAIEMEFRWKEPVKVKTNSEEIHAKI